MNRVLEHLIVYLQWLIVTAVAFPVGLLASSTVLVSLGVPLESDLLGPVSSLLTGILVAIAQLLVLGEAKRNLWIAITAVGVAAGSWITIRVIGTSSIPFTALLGGLLGGIVPGMLQLGLINTRLWKRGEWLLLTVVGWGLAYLIGGLFLSNAASVTGLLAIESSQHLALVGWSTTGLFAVLLLLLFTPIARRRELSGRITWLP